MVGLNPATEAATLDAIESRPCWEILGEACCNKFGGVGVSGKRTRIFGLFINGKVDITVDV